MNTLHTKNYVSSRIAESTISIYVQKVDAHTRLMRKALIFSGGRGYIGPAQSRARSTRYKDGTRAVGASQKLISNTVNLSIT